MLCVSLTNLSSPTHHIITGRYEQHAGLGAHVAHSARARESHPEAVASGEGKSDDMYNQYRHNRSGSYHQMIRADLLQRGKLDA